MTGISLPIRVVIPRWDPAVESRVGIPPFLRAILELRDGYLRLDLGLIGVLRLHIRCKLLGAFNRILQIRQGVRVIAYTQIQRV